METRASPAWGDVQTYILRHTQPEIVREGERQRGRKRDKRREREGGRETERETERDRGRGRGLEGEK